MEQRLRAWGYEPVIAVCGNSAWAVLQQPDAPSIALLDWLMPGMDGPAIVRNLRAARTEPHTWVFLVTGRTERAHLLEGLAAGADDYLTKPFDDAELEVRLRNAARVVSLQRDLVAARELLRRQAGTDPLTSIANRGAAHEALVREVSRSRRERTPISVLLVDLD